MEILTVSLNYIRMIQPPCIHIRDERTRNILVKLNKLPEKKAEQIPVGGVVVVGTQVSKLE